MCIYTVVLQIDLLQTDALLPGDETALTWARDIEMGVLTTIADVLAVIGRLWFVVPVTAVACAFLLTRREGPRRSRCRRGWRSRRSRRRSSRAPWTGPGRGTGSPTWTDSPTRPGTPRSSVTYLALAVVLSRAVPAAWRIALVITGTVLAVAIGLSRVYLRVHYLTDVVGGWAVGLAVFSLCGAVALVVDYLRQQLGRFPQEHRPSEWTASQSPTSSSERPA